MSYVFCLLFAWSIANAHVLHDRKTGVSNDDLSKDAQIARLTEDVRLLTAENERHVQQGCSKLDPVALRKKDEAKLESVLGAKEDSNGAKEDSNHRVLVRILNSLGREKTQMPSLQELMSPRGPGASTRATQLGDSHNAILQTSAAQTSPVKEMRQKCNVIVDTMELRLAMPTPSERQVKSVPAKHANATTVRGAFLWSPKVLASLATIEPRYAGGLQTLWKPSRWPTRFGNGKMNATTLPQGYWMFHADLLDSTCSKVKTTGPWRLPAHNPANTKHYIQTQRSELKAWFLKHPLASWRGDLAPIPGRVSKTLARQHPAADTVVHQEPTDNTRSFMFSSMSPAVTYENHTFSFINDGNAIDWLPDNGGNPAFVRNDPSGKGNFSDANNQHNVCRLQANIVNAVDLHTTKLAPAFSRSLSNSLRRNVISVQPLYADGVCSLYLYTRSMQSHPKCNQTCSKWNPGLVRVNDNASPLFNCCMAVHHFVEKVPCSDVDRHHITILTNRNLLI